MYRETGEDYLHCVYIGTACLALRVERESRTGAICIVVMRKYKGRSTAAGHYVTGVHRSDPERDLYGMNVRMRDWNQTIRE